MKTVKILILHSFSGKSGKITEQMKDTLQAQRPDTVVEVWDNTESKLTYADLKKAEADLFVNFNLTGFEQSTLTDGIAYNLLNCKQIHILLDKNLPNEKYLAKQLSISMFFYCIGAEYCRYLWKKYPDLPYLKEIGGLQVQAGEMQDSILENADALCGVVREVLEICHMM